VVAGKVAGSGRKRVVAGAVSPVSDPGLIAVIEGWPALSDQQRAAVLKIVREFTKGGNSEELFNRNPDSVE
jgi:hypothetical protein